jgi:hypothetical protein
MQCPERHTTAIAVQSHYALLNILNIAMSREDMTLVLFLVRVPQFGRLGV